MKHTVVGFLLGAITVLPVSSAWADTSVSYYDDTIVFQFADDYEVGQFANGDYWVHNNGEPVVITSISPVSTTSSNRQINGTMVNPEVGQEQGYDSYGSSVSPDMEYDATLNLDPGKTGSSLTVEPGSSVIKAISMPTPQRRPAISDAAVLTVLAEAPAEGSFRPPYVGTDKTITATTSDLDYDQLGHYPLLGTESDIEEIAETMERVWLEHNTEWTQRDIHPKNNMPTYGRDIAKASGNALLALQMDYSDEEKQTLLIRMVQYGIDLYGVACNGGNWYNNGGHNLGRKMPLLLAAKVLHNEEMLAYGDKEQHFIFQDDQQHFYVSQDDVDMTHSDAWAPDSRAEAIPYTASDIGMAEWGIRHADRPYGDNRNWEATYRDVNGYSETMHVFAAMLMGVQEEWNWPAVFDYVDRFYDTEQENFSDHFQALWTKYRDDLSYQGGESSDS